MDRIILHFQQDEPDDDFNTACRVISPQNIIETELLLLVLKRAATEHFNDTKANAQTLLAVSMKLIKSKRPKQAADGLHLVSKIIYRNPTDSTVFLDAILARSLQMMRTQKYPLTRNDLRYYKSFPVHNMTPEGLVLVQTLLCSALYYTREMSEARAELFQLETGLQILSDQIIRENQELYTFLMHLERYKKEIREPSKNVNFRRKPKAVPYFPLRGFNLDRKIPAASHLCEYISEEGERGVYARKYIPAKSIVIVESGQNFQFSAPFMNCEMCGAYEENLYTCSECRSKCYCSNACLKYDWEEHQYECYGYLIGIIPMFEAKILFRFFVQAAKCLSPALAAYTLQNGPIRNASVAWDFIIESARSYNREARTIGEFLCRQPDMNLFTPAKWRQLVTIALRLAVFVYNDSNIPETFFDTLKLTKNDSIILYTTLFLRLSTHIVLNSQQNEMEYHYEIPGEDPVPDPQPQAMQRMNMNAFAFFSIYAHTDFVNSFRRVENRIQHIREWKPFEGLFANTKRLPTDVGSPMYEFCTKLLNVVIRKKEIRVFNDLYNSDNALSPVEIEKYFENLNTSDRCTILEEFARLFQQHMYDYFRNEKRQEKTALCVTMKKVAHACDANTEIRALRDGTYLAVTKKSLRPGTQLTISQSSVSHLSMSRAERRAYFQAIGTSCDCKACTGHPLLEPTNVRQAIFCAYCLTEVEITPLHGNCRQCNSNYHQFMQNYSKFVSCALEEIHFREKHRRTTQRELSCLYGMYHSYVTMHYAKGHEIRLSAVIIFVEHLIKKGFINHACDMIFALLDIDFSMNTPLTRKEIEKKIFNLLRRVTQCYIDSFLNCDAMAVDTSYPKMLLYALKYMLRVQEKDFELAIDDREEYNTHLAHYTEYYKWKIIINSNLTMPLVLQRYLTEN